MRITYTNTFVEVLRFQIAHQFVSAGHQAIYSLLCVFVYFAEAQARTSVVSLTIAAGWYVFAWVVQIPFTALILGTKRSPIDKVEHILEIQEDALFEETKFNRSYHYWNGPMRLVRRGGLSAIYVTPLQAHLVPNRAFASPQEEQNFWALLRNKLALQQGAA